MENTNTGWLSLNDNGDDDGDAIAIAIKNLCKLAQEEKRKPVGIVPLELVQEVNNASQYPDGSVEAEFITDQGRYANCMFEYQYQHIAESFDKAVNAMCRISANYTSFTGIDNTSISSEQSYYDTPEYAEFTKKVMALAEKRGKTVSLLINLAIKYERLLTFLDNVLDDPYHQHFCYLASNKIPYCVFLADVDSTVYFSSASSHCEDIETQFYVDLIDFGSSFGFDFLTVSYKHSTEGWRKFTIECTFRIEKKTLE